jgi:hypothetical protein
MKPLPLRPALLVLAVGLVALAGCDSALTDPDVVILTHELTRSGDGSAVSFSFDADDVTVGQSTVLRCGCTVDLDPWLASQGFSRDDIVEATVQSASLTMRLPVLERVDFLERAELRFEAAGLQPAEVATRSVFPDARDVDLTPVSGRSVRAFAARDEFEPVLVIEAADLQAGAEYEMTVAVTLRLELEGF